MITKSKDFRLWFFIIASAILYSCTTNKKAIDKNDTMYAMIYDFDNNPVVGAEVYIDGKRLGTSDMQGRFMIGAPRRTKKETVAIEITKPLYENIQAEITYDPMQIGYFRMGTAEQYYTLAENNLSYNMPEKALEHISKAESLDQSRTDIIYLKALALYLVGKKEESNEELDKLENKKELLEYVNALREKNNE